MSEDIKCCDDAVNYDCISRSRIVRQILEIDDININPKALNKILEKIQNEPPYNVAYVSNK